MPRVQIKTALGPTQRRTISGLRAFNARVVGNGEGRSLAIALRQGRGIVGGLTGWTWMGWCFVELLLRTNTGAKKYGTAPMQKAEQEARKRGVERIYIDTFSFQAPGFYKKLGYKQFARLKDFPKGHNRYWLKKAL
jgi:GNAT superfamily N-acetyltransferase